MVYYDVQPLNDLIREFFELHKGPDYLDEVKAVNSWGQVVGKFIASHTIDVCLRNKFLFVRVDSDVLRNELSYSKSELIGKINDFVGKEVVKEMVLN